MPAATRCAAPCSGHDSDTVRGPFSLQVVAAALKMTMESEAVRAGGVAGMCQGGGSVVVRNTYFAHLPSQKHRNTETQNKYTHQTRALKHAHAAHARTVHQRRVPPTNTNIPRCPGVGYGGGRSSGRDGGAVRGLRLGR